MTAAPSGPSSRTLKRLFGLSNNRCAFPRCGRALIEGETIIGEACHIRAASPGGPRFDPDQTSAERHGFENLILLCANHHTVIDDDEEAYSVERLLTMKATHETSSSPMGDADAERGGMAISIGRSGRITAHRVDVHTAHFHGYQNNSPASREESAIAFLTPELARMLAYQIHALDRAMVNFTEISVGRSVLNDSWETFRPRRPIHYPGAAQVRDLGAEAGGLIAEFYSALDEIEALFGSWRETELRWDLNAWNFLMQKIGASIRAGIAAADRFCPGRRYDTTMPMAGTLAERAAQSLSGMEGRLEAHLARFNGPSRDQAHAKIAELAESPRGLAPVNWPAPYSGGQLRERLQTAWWDFVCRRFALRDLPVVVSDPRVLIHVTPEVVLGEPPFLDLLTIDQARSLLQLPDEVYQGANSSHWWSHGEARRAPGRVPEADWATSFFRTGIVEWDISLGPRPEGEEKIEVGLERVEDLIIQAIDTSLTFLDVVGIRGATLVSAILYGMELAIPMLGRRQGQRFRQQSFNGPPVLLPSGERHCRQHLKPMFEPIWLEAGSPLGTPSFNGSKWIRTVQDL